MTEFDTIHAGDPGLERPKYEPAEGGSIEEIILNTLVGTSRTTRLGPRPDRDTLSVLSDNIRYKVHKGEPLEITSAWGACKTSPGYSHGADIAEVLALQQYDAIGDAVRKTYPPGINFNIVLSDSYYEYLYGANGAVQEYSDEMAGLVEQYPQFHLGKTSELHTEIGDTAFVRCEDNLEKLRQYWHDTKGLDVGHWQELESYKELLDIGWIGQISLATREFYMNRMGKLFPDESVEQHSERVLKFFAYGLLLKQYDVFKRGDAEGCTADFCLLRVPPPDMPKALHGNRLRVRCVPSWVSNSSAPPWTVEGAFIENEVGLLRPRLISDVDLSRSALRKVRYQKLIDVNVYKAEGKV